MTDSIARASTKERFDLLLVAMIRFQERFVDSGFKVAAVLTVFVGWLLAASSAQAFLQDSPQLLWAACLTVACIGTAVVLFSLFQARVEAERLYTRLCELGYMQEGDLVQYRLKPRLFWSVVLLNGVICALIIAGLVLVRFVPGAS